MSKDACWCVIPAAVWILFFIPSGIIAQSSASNPEGAIAPSKQLQSSPSAPALDPTLEAISKAEQEGRLLDAEKLLTAAVHEAGSASAPNQRMSRLLKLLAGVEINLGRYPDAIVAMQKALAIDKEIYQPEGAGSLVDLYALAAYNRRAGNQVDADRATGEALALARKFPGLHNATLVTALWQASLNAREGHRSDEAHALLAEAAKICQAQGELETNICPVVLSNYYRETGDTGQVEKVLLDAAAQGPVDYHGHADFGHQLNALGQLAAHYQQEGSYALAEATYQKEIAVAENYILNPLVAPRVYYQYGRLLEIEGKDKEAEAAYKHAFDTFEHMQGRFRTHAIQELSDAPLVRLYQKEGRTSDAVTILDQVLVDQEQVLDPNDVHLASTLITLARMKAEGGKHSEAEPLCERALKIQEVDYGKDSPQLARILSLYASVERGLGHKDKADTLAARAAALRQRASPVSKPGP